jgi:hypothetical protein
VQVRIVDVQREGSGRQGPKVHARRAVDRSQVLDRFVARQILAIFRLTTEPEFDFWTPWL